MDRDIPISFRSILVLFDLLKNLNQMEIQYLKQLYSRNAENFEVCVDFISSLNLLNVNSDQIELSPHLSNFLLKQPNESKIQEFILNKLLNKRNTYVWEYLEKFSTNDDRIFFEPEISENLRFSNLRNLLIELELVLYDPEKRMYEISEKYLHLFKELVIEHKISPEKLKWIIEEQERIGKYAEFEIVAYEKSRLSSREDLVAKIQHVSLEDTKAGYDIKSFTIEKDNDRIERFIEVKAVSTVKKKFFISRNEVEKSKLHSDKYYIYLLPVIGKNKFDLNNLIIIQDPSSKLFNSAQWQVSCENFVIVNNEEQW